MKLAQSESLNFSINQCTYTTHAFVLAKSVVCQVICDAIIDDPAISLGHPSVIA